MEEKKEFDFSHIVTQSEGKIVSACNQVIGFMHGRDLDEKEQLACLIALTVSFFKHHGLPIEVVKNVCQQIVNGYHEHLEDEEV
jgi:hypothetical protein